MDSTIIARLIHAGGNRWQKAGHDRIYFSAKNLDMTKEWENRDFADVDMALVNFWADGHKISRRVLGCLNAAEAWIDVKSGAVYSVENTPTTPTQRYGIIGATANRVRYLLAAAIADSEKNSEREITEIADILHANLANPENPIGKISRDEIRRYYLMVKERVLAEAANG